jgi:hypothetical protein
MVTQGIRVAALAALAGLAGGCSEKAAVPTPVSFETVFSSAMCGSDVAIVAPVVDAAGLRKAIGADAPRSFNEPPPPTLDIPSADTATLWHVAIGQKSTAGYVVTVDRVERNDNTLTFVVDWQEPAAGAMTAQVITRPCVVLRLPPIDVKQARVVDRAGNTRMAWPVPSA